MALKYKVETIEEVEEQFRALYAKDDSGAFILDVEDNPYKQKVDEFRGNNIELQKKIDEMEKKIAAAENSKTQALSIEKGEAQKVIDELNSQLSKLQEEMSAQLASKDERISKYEEREKAKLDKILERLPEDVRGKFEGLDVDKALELAEVYDTNFTSRKHIPDPKIPGRPNTDADISKLSPKEKLVVYSQQQKAEGA